MRKILKSLIIILLLMPIIYFGIFFTQGQTMKKSFIKFYGLEDVKENEKPYSFKRCNLNIFDSEFVYLTGKNMALISFYSPKEIFSQTSEEWRSSRTGGTTIKNTTFPELVEMVKEDCSQFQEGHGDYYGEDLAWSYSPYEPEPEKTPEEIQRMQYEDDMHELFYQWGVEDGTIKPRPSASEESFGNQGYSE